MTYIITLDEQNVFNALRAWLIRKGWGFRKLFWATGLLAFLISPVADNLTTALLMATVALAVSNGNPQFIVPAFANIAVWRWATLGLSWPRTAGSGTSQGKHMHPPGARPFKNFCGFIGR